MKIFIICCLLFIHVNMCIFICGFRVSIRVSGIRGFGFGDGFLPESVSGSGSGFDFGFRFFGARRFHPIRTRPVAILSLKRPFDRTGGARPHIPSHRVFFTMQPPLLFFNRQAVATEERTASVGVDDVAIAVGFGWMRGKKLRCA